MSIHPKFPNVYPDEILKNKYSIKRNNQYYQNLKKNSHSHGFDTISRVSIHRIIFNIALKSPAENWPPKSLTKSGTKSLDLYQTLPFPSNTTYII